MINTTTPLRTFQLALIASAAIALTACSRSEPDAAASTATANTPAQVAVAPAPAPVAVAPAPAPVVVAQNNTYDQGRRDQQRQDARNERPLPPRADRDVDLPPQGSEAEQQRWRHEHQVAAAACSECGVVESIVAVKVQGQNNGVGAVAGGVGGAVVGSQIAGGHNRTLGGLVGAVGGGLIGNAVEKHERTSTVYDVHVRMSDGSLRTVRQSTSPAIGEKVRVEADGLHDRA